MFGIYLQNKRHRELRKCLINQKQGVVLPGSGPHPDAADSKRVARIHADSSYIAFRCIVAWRIGRGRSASQNSEAPHKALRSGILSPVGMDEILRGLDVERVTAADGAIWAWRPLCRIVPQWHQGLGPDLPLAACYQRRPRGRVSLQTSREARAICRDHVSDFAEVVYKSAACQLSGRAHQFLFLAMSLSGSQILFFLILPSRWLTRPTFAVVCGSPRVSPIAPNISR